MSNGEPVLDWSVPCLSDDSWVVTARAGEATLVAFPFRDGWEWQVHVNRRLVDRGGASTMTRAMAMAERFNNERRTA